MDVDSRQLIDAQFDRAVEIVQGLPKTGPIQTGYEEKLDMYRCVLRVNKFTIRVEHVCSPVCTSKVTIPTSSDSCSLHVSNRPTRMAHQSYCRERSRTTPSGLGYVGQGEMVRMSVSLF